MRLVFIYGPPASGKLTIAKELVSLTGYNLYHNHLVVDLVSSLFDREKYGQIFLSLIAEVNLFMISNAAREEVPGVVMTSCYIHPDEKYFIKEIVGIINNYQSEICFVQIVCNQDELKKRVRSRSRRKFGKLMDPEKLANLMDKKDLNHKIDHTHNLSINNTNLSALKVAHKIQNHFGL